MIISVSGKINSGKDIVGEIVQIISASPHFTDEAVVEFLGKPKLNPKWKNKKFADKLKDMACMLLGCTREQLEDREFKEKELGEEWDCWVNNSSKINNPPQLTLDRPSNFFNDLGGVSHRKLTPRLLLQLVGTECGRQIIHPNIWVNTLMSEYNCLECGENSAINGIEIHKMPNWIITDTRFPNEMKAVKDRNGITIRINRNINLPGGGELGYQQHESETALDNAKFDYVIENDGELADLVAKVREIMLKERLW